MWLPLHSLGRLTTACALLEQADARQAHARAEGAERALADVERGGGERLENLQRVQMKASEEGGNLVLMAHD